VRRDAHRAPHPVWPLSPGEQGIGLPAARTVLNVRMEARGRKTIQRAGGIAAQIPSWTNLLAQPRLAALSKRVDRNLVVKLRAPSSPMCGTDRGRFELDALGLSAASHRRAHQHRSRTNSFALAAAVIMRPDDSAHDLGPGAAAGDSRGRIPPQRHAVQPILNMTSRVARAQARRAYRRVADAPDGAEAAIVVTIGCGLLVTLARWPAAASDRLAGSSSNRRRFEFPRLWSRARDPSRSRTTNRTHLGITNSHHERTRVFAPRAPFEFQITGFTDKPSSKSSWPHQRSRLPSWKISGRAALLIFLSTASANPREAKHRCRRSV